MVENQVVAVKPVKDKTIEDQLETSGQLTIKEAMSLNIESQKDYEQAGKFLVEIKTRAKQVKDYWAQPKTAAKNAHQTIVDREKAMLAPLLEAERMVKSSMVNYQTAVELARRHDEEEARKRQQEEADRLLQRALDAQDSGNEQIAMVNLAMAEMVDQMPAQLTVEAPKAVGTSVSKTWKARIVDEKVVPAYINGMMIRKIDMSALNGIAKMTKGTAEIPGVEFYQDTTISARS